LPYFKVSQRDTRHLRPLEITLGDGTAMGAKLRITQELSQPVNDQIGCGMLQTTGMLVDIFPADPKIPAEENLPQTMATG
jgi:hypothetical protein